MSTPEIHIFDQHEEAEKAEIAAKEKVEALVAVISSVADRLKHWTTVGFHGLSSTGVPTMTLGADSLIRFDELPSLHAIADAITDWRTRNSETASVVSRMTDSQRQKIGLSPR